MVKRVAKREAKAAVVKTKCTKQQPANPVASFRVASDCSGIDVPIAVLEQLNIATHHVFSSEIDRCLRDFLQARFAPDTMYPDMTIRNNHVPRRPAETDFDLYSVGLPCQPFSKSGKNLGEGDPKDDGRRGLLFH